MSRKIRLWCICGIVALGLFAPSLMLGQEIPGALQTEMDVPSQAPDLNVSQDEKPITLEEIKEMFGPRNVCGAWCGGWPVKNCSELCGDYAVCWNNYCLFA